jgi:phosphohistidine phosphatase
MEIWLLRHALAEERSDSGRDADRTLTEDGHKRARDVARGLARLEPGIEIVLTSPYARARQTAEPAARALHLKIRETQALEPSSDPQEILDEVRGEKAGSILLVGHEPHLGALLGRLVAGRAGLEIPMRKASVARLTWTGSGAATLRALLPAKVLARLASADD